jgi:protein TonB
MVSFAMSSTKLDLAAPRGGLTLFRGGRKGLRNGGTLAVVVALHLLPFVGLMATSRMPTAAPVIEPVIMVELARTQAPPQPVSELPPGPQQVEAAASRPTPRELEKVRITTPRTDVEPLVVPDPTPQPAAPTAQATPAPATTAPLSRPAPPAASASSAPMDWQGRLLAHLEANKRYPTSALSRRQQGVAHVRFVMNREGRVLSSRLERSSGNAALDRAALDMLTRAQPLPRPPAEVVGDRIELVVPVEFFIGRRG